MSALSSRSAHSTRRCGKGINYNPGRGECRSQEHQEVLFWRSRSLRASCSPTPGSRPKATSGLATRQVHRSSECMRNLSFKSCGSAALPTISATSLGKKGLLEFPQPLLCFQVARIAGRTHLSALQLSLSNQEQLHLPSGQSRSG